MLSFLGHHKERERHLLQALQLAASGLEHIEGYTSRHCSDCMMNRDRAQQVEFALWEIVGTKPFDFIDRSAVGLARCRIEEIERRVREEQQRRGG